MMVKARSADERRTILLVEDDPAVRRTLHLLLQAQGYLIRAYASGSALLADDSTLDADGMVADYMLPDMDGLDILKGLRTKGWTGAALLITGFPSDQLDKEARSCGFAEMVVKPLLGQSLAASMERALAEAGAA